jgi:sarcosine oxidase
MGSATCFELARRGKRVLGLEQYDIPHDQGSSHGHTRIIRLAYYEDPSYVMLLHRSYQLWREIQERVHEQLLFITGSIDAGPADSWVFKGAWQSALEHNLAHEILTGRELSQRFPGYQLPHETMALYQPDGGFLAPERCIVAYVNAAIVLGAEIHGRERVLEWQPLSDGVRVTTTRDIYEADSLVITAGAWNAHMIDQLTGLAVPERQVLAWLQPLRPELFTLERFPVFNLLVPEGRYYGFPVFSIPGFKFGKYHHFEEKGPAEQLDFEPHDYDEEMLRDFAGRYFPDGCGSTMSLAACMFTNTPDGHFIIDLHPVYSQVSFAAGFSGHGFKFASVIGEIMADLAERGDTRHNIELFRLDRFSGQGMEARRRRAEAQRRRGAGEQRRRGAAEHHGPRTTDHGPRITHHPVRNTQYAIRNTHHAIPDTHSVLAQDDLDAIRPFW